MSVINYAPSSPFFASEKFAASSDADLTLREAADVLLVSEPFLVALLDSGEIPSQKIGNQYRLHLEDILAFQAERKRLHLEAVDELVEEGQLFNPNY